VSDMSNVLPYTKRDRQEATKRAFELRKGIPDNPSFYQRQVMGTTTDILRWEATVLQVKAALAEMTRERDDLRRYLDVLSNVSDAVASMTASQEALPQPSGNSGWLGEATP